MKSRPSQASSERPVLAFSRLAAKPSNALLALGSASALIYLLAFALPYWLPTYYLGVQDEIYQFAAREPWRGVLFYAALALLFGFYLAAYRWTARAGHRPVSPWAIGLWAAIFCLLLIPSQPFASSDVYGYVFQGRIVAVLGQNPFAHLYKDFAGDPFYFCVTFHNLPAATGYGPLWIAMAAGLGWLARGQLLLNLFLFKVLAAGLHLLGALVVYAALRRLAPEKRSAAMLLYAWNPVLLYELVGNAHNDAAVAALSLLGFCLLGLPWTARAGLGPQPGEGRDVGEPASRWGWLAFPCLAVAALVKPVVALWLPLAAVWWLAHSRDWPGRLRRAAIVAALTLGPVAAFYAPFWVGSATFQGLWAQSDIHGNSLPNLLIQALVSLWSVPASQVIEWVKLLTVAAFAPFYLWQLWRVWQSGGQGNAWQILVRAGFDVMLFYVLFVGFQFWPWYLTWLVAPAALLDGPPRSLRSVVTVILCLLAPWLYFPFGWQWARQHLPAWSVALFSSLPLMALCLWLLVHRWRARHLFR